MTIEELITLWMDGVIPFRGKKELISRFLEKFDLKSNTSFHEIMRNDESPTPLQFEWLAVEITRYHDYYEKIQNGDGGKQLEMKLADEPIS